VRPFARSLGLQDNRAYRVGMIWKGHVRDMLFRQLCLRSWPSETAPAAALYSSLKHWEEIIEAGEMWLLLLSALAQLHQSLRMTWLQVSMEKEAGPQCRIFGTESDAAVWIMQ